MVIVFFFVSLMIGGAFMQFLFHIDVSRMNDILLNPQAYPNGIIALKFIQVFAHLGTFVVPAILFSRALNQNPVLFLKINHHSRTYNYLLALLLVLVATPFTSWLYGFNLGLRLPASYADLEALLRQWEESARMQQEAFMIANTWPEYLTNLFVMAIVPAIAEELFFRGCLQNFVRMCFYNLHISVFFTAIIFSSIHGQFFGFLPRLAFGVILGYAFAFSGNIWVSITAHFFNNAMVIIAGFMATKHTDVAFLKEDYLFPMYINVLSLILTAGILLLMSRLQYRNIFIEPQANNEHE